MFQNLHSADTGRSDADMWRGQLELALQAEPLGFDSVWTAEHHFGDYIVSPHPALFLTYLAARTQRVRLGAHVFVLPWHHPVRLAEELCTLDALAGGRFVAAFGRGLGASEFDGLSIEMGKSRQLFVEYATAISEGLETGVMEYDGEVYQQPRVEIRPRPTVTFRGRTYASAISPESMKIMARLGYGLMIIPQKPWETTIEEVTMYRDLYREVNGEEAPRPVLTNFLSIHEDGQRAREIQQEYGIAYSRSAALHYEFTNERLETVPGYEYYAGLRKGIEKRGFDRFVRFLADLQITGTPDEVVEQTIDRVRLIDAGGVLNCFNFGGMSDELGTQSMKLYAHKVLPQLKQFEPEREIGSRSAAPDAARVA